ncbi:hypothetical protein D3C87_1791440 [compost metagenome]
MLGDDGLLGGVLGGGEGGLLGGIVGEDGLVGSLLGGLLGGKSPVADILEPVSSVLCHASDAVAPVVAEATQAASGAAVPAADILAGASSAVAPVVAEVVNTVEHAVTPLVCEVVAPITSLLDHSGTGSALAPVTNILHGLLG